ncbi:MAG: hypothetical protein JXB40_01725 [Candidatus Omnitrophica bacterium]|nr:hypothetical protein [Candidatus Omnitrophota bacterium]
MRNSKGFLLLEVVLATVMVTSGLLFVGRVYSSAKSAMERSRTLFHSSFLLEQKMFDLQISDAVYDTGRVKFQNNKGCYWEVRSTAFDRKAPGFLKITLNVFLPSGKTSTDTYWLETYLMKNIPEESR